MKKFVTFVILIVCALQVAWAQTNYVFYNATYGFIYNNDGSVGVKTTFDESCIWRASGELGSTSRNIYSYIDKTKYLRGSGSSPYISLGESQSYWRGSNNCLRYKPSSSNNYYINYNGSFSVSTSSYTDGFTYYTVSITNATTPTFAISYPTADAYIGNVNGTMSISANVSGNYRPKYYTVNNDRYYLDGGTTYSNSAPSQVSNYNLTYELVGECADYATISGSTVTYTTDAGHDVVAQVKVTAKPQGYPDVIVGQEICSFVLRSATVAAPVITRIEGTNQYQITTTSQGASIKYTIDGTDIDEWASNGTAYSGPITVTTDGAVIKAKAVREGKVSAQTAYTVSGVVLMPPTITISDAGVVTITNPNTFAASSVIRYTTDGSTPTASSATFSSYTATNMQTIKAIVTAAGYGASPVALEQYVVESGVNGSVVTLNDYEDHNWTYYSDPESPIKSLYPRNVKITYLGNGIVYKAAEGSETSIGSTDIGTESGKKCVAATGVAVSRYETANTFVYYKTLERDANNSFPYTLIPNPFSKRPTYGEDATTKWRGFYKWRVKSVSGGGIYASSTGGTALGVGSLLNAETEYFFRPSDNTATNANNATSMTVELEAVWARSYRVTAATNTTNTQIAADALKGGTYERNFVVISSYATSRNSNIVNTSSKPVTITMIEPDGSTDYRSATVYINPAYIMAQNDWKFEWINIQNNSSTISANGHNLVLGRGILRSGVSHDAGNGVYGTAETDLTASYVNGLGNGTSAGQSNYTSALDFKLRIESGAYTSIGYLAVKKGRYGKTTSTIHVNGVYGNDYDRAIGNNDRLISKGGTNGNDNPPAVCLCFDEGAGIDNSNHNNYNKETLFLTIKSGYIGQGQTVSSSWEPGNNGLYMGGSFGTNPRTCGNRRLLMEGGKVISITGGMDRTATNSQTKNDNNVETLIMRFKGTAEILTSAFGGAAQNPTYGNRHLIFTGGTVHGWVATGCNGIANSAGQNYGIGYMYVGGNAKVGDGSLGNINGTGRGIVMGAGNGRSSSATTGEMTFGSNVVIADNADIENNVFGGGNYGYVGTQNASNSDAIANIYIAGGTVHGNVYGGSNQKHGEHVKITMVGGLVEGGVYGGSNVNGDIRGNVELHINGGQVGTTSKTANVHGGGLGNETRVLGSVNVEVGRENAGVVSGDAVIYGDVYGGSAEGMTNGNTSRTTGSVTNVTLNAGTINGSLYGGGLGTASYAADVFAPVTVTINGGSATNVFGCNNTNGAPQSTVKVNMTGGLVRECVYGGGNAAAYTGNPQVSISGGEVDKHVFGGGLGANAVVTGSTDVKVTEAVDSTTLIKGNVYGGGNAALVTGDTNVQIGE